MHIRTNKKLNEVFKPVIKFCEWLGTNHPIVLARIRYFARFHKPLHLNTPQDVERENTVLVAEDGHVVMD